MLQRYTLPQAIAFVTETTQVDDTSHVTNLLEGSKAGDGTYRPYYVCGVLFWLKPSNDLIKGEGAQFDQNTTVTYRYLTLQQKIDTALNLVVDPSFTGQALIDALQILPTEENTGRSMSIGFLGIDF